MKWKLPVEKANKTQGKIVDALKNEKVNLLQMQKLLGSLNDISLMCPFLQGFKKPLNSHLTSLLENPLGKQKLCDQAKKDLIVFYNFLNSKEQWFPIPSRPYAPPIVKVIFTSDAAGCNERTAPDENVGCASVGLNLNGEIFFAKQMFWSTEVLNSTIDENQKKFN